MNTPNLIAALLLASFLLLNTIAAQEQATGIPPDATPWAELRVVLKDEAGNPVAGAAVKPYAMRMVEGGGHGYWDEKKYGAPKDYLSDPQGVAVVRYPAKVLVGNVTMTTRLVTFSVGHSDFVQKTVHLDLAMDASQPLEKAEVELKKGCELVLSAVDDNGASVSDFGVMIAGPSAPEYWAEDGQGGRRTSALSDGTWQTMLVKPQKNGPTLFSGLLPLRVRPSQAVKMRNIKLSPGARIVGKLSDNVPRPITRGYVMTRSLPKPAGDSYAEESPSLAWEDSVPITADGSFALPSVPRSGVIQLIAVCTGWVSQTTIPEAHTFVMGQLFDVDNAQVEFTLQMEQTGTLELTILKPDGTPLDGGKVSAWPNEKLYKGGSTLLGQNFHSIRWIENQLLPIEQRTVPYTEATDLPFLEQPVKNGVVILSGLPIGNREICSLQHPEYDFPVNDDNKEPRLRFELNDPEPAKMTVTVVPHP